MVSQWPPAQGGRTATPRGATVPGGGESSPKGIKRCPACAEYTRAEAVICRTCSYDWRTGMLVGAHRATNGLAVAAMCLGVFSTIVFFLVPVSIAGGILAIVLGTAGKRQIKRSQGLQIGSEMATAGIVLGWIALAVAIVLLVLFLAAGIETIAVDVNGI